MMNAKMHRSQLAEREFCELTEKNETICENFVGDEWKK